MAESPSSPVPDDYGTDLQTQGTTRGRFRPPLTDEGSGVLSEEKRDTSICLHPKDPGRPCSGLRLGLSSNSAQGDGGLWRGTLDSKVSDGTW